jgi:hypothetical protein
MNLALRWRASWMLITALTLTLTVLPPTPSARAAVAKAPTGLSPSATSVSGAPTLAWTPSTGALGYTVEISRDLDFSPVIASTTTVNRRWVPTAQLPRGELFWRVRADNGSGAGPWAQASFVHGADGGPALASPSDGFVFTQPDDPAVLTWSPTPGARAYEVQVSSASSDFPTDSRTTTTRATNSAYLITAPQINQPYYWRVRAELGSDVYSDWSETRTYSVSDLDKPELVAPTDSGDTSIQDMVLDWRPVPGASSYDVRLSTDINFSEVTHQANGVTGTRYSPPTTLDNDQYYWQVRPIDTFGQAAPWETVDTWNFRRHWPEQPGLTYPADGAVVGDPFFFQWTPSQKASRYVVQTSTNSSFDTISGTCTSVHNTIVPAPTVNTCMPAAAGTYYWRVTAYDDPKGVLSEPLQSEVRSFSYLPEMVDLDSATPTDGATVTVPTLRWQQVPGAAKYQVYISRVSDGAQIVAGAQTYTTTYTPRTALAVGTTYRWWVRTVTGGGRSGATLVPSAQSTFTVAAQPTATSPTPEGTAPANGTHVQRFPALTWTPVPNATHYRIYLRDANSIAAPVALPDTFSYPAGDDTSINFLLPATYEWHVEAFNGSASLGEGAPRTFVVDSLAPVTGQRVAMSGTASQSAATSCTDVVPQRCTGVRQSPVLRWDPVDHAGSYKVVLSRDNQFTNIFATYFADTNAYIPIAALPESQAEDAYYWIVLPCKHSTQSACRGLSAATHAFSKLSNPVELLSPADDPDPSNTHPIANEITFTWRDYLATNFDPANPASKRDEAGQNGGVEARTYRIQVSTTPNFSGTTWQDDVDQTTYTEYSNAYPEGVLYWRVRAIDHTGTLLPWSETRTVYKKSPPPAPSSPVGGAVVSPGTPLRWVPQNYADGYEVEIYRDGDSTFQPVNRVAVATTQQAAWAPPTPLPVRTLPYTWRIRRIDVSGFKGPWSSDSTKAPNASFRVRSVAPTLVTPATGAYVPAASAVFSWAAVDDAERYRFERRRAGDPAVVESVPTIALSWAPTARLADGSYEWRVVAINNQGYDIRGSAWRSVKVDSTRPTVTAKSPTGRVYRTTSFNVRFSERVTNVTTTTFRINRVGYPTPLSATVTLSSTGRSATINPAANLLVGKSYYVKLSTDIKDPAGNRLVATQWKVTAK